VDFTPLEGSVFPSRQCVYELLVKEGFVKFEEKEESGGSVKYI
jgi:hypothetical protein